MVAEVAMCNMLVCILAWLPGAQADTSSFCCSLSSLDCSCCWLHKKDADHATRGQHKYMLAIIIRF